MLPPAPTRCTFTLLLGLSVLALPACGSPTAVPELHAPTGPQAGAPVAPSPRSPNGPGPTAAAEANDDPRSAEVANLLGATLGALQRTPDAEAAATAILPYLHRSLLDASGAHLTADVRTFSFKKAHGAAGLYANPVKITRVRPSNVTAIGFGPTAEQGRSVDYFVAKRDGVAGMPAPVTVFFPASGGPPKVSGIGSL